jgi:hypothetical protein
VLNIMLDGARLACSGDCGHRALIWGLLIYGVMGALVITGIFERRRLFIESYAKGWLSGLMAMIYSFMDLIKISL